MGVLLFGGLFALTFLSTATLEQSARSFVTAQIEKEVTETLKLQALSSMAKGTQKLAGTLGLEEQELWQQMKEKLPEKIAATLAKMCGYDCKREKAWAGTIKKVYLEKIQSLAMARQNLNHIIKGKYLEIVGKLRKDLRIFLGANFAMYLALLSLSFLKQRAIAHLFLPGLLLFVSTITASAIYLFGQNWFYTILYDRYTGYWFLIYLAVIFAFLMDIALNRARVTANVLNVLANLVGTTARFFPC